jgi:hypothetical protein
MSTIMAFGRPVATALLTVAAAAATAGTAHAAPVPAPPAAETIHYQMKLVDRTVVVTLDRGTFVVAGDGKSVDIKDPAGRSVVELPLSFQRDNVTYPLEHSVTGGGEVLRLTPTPGLSTTKPQLVHPIASPAEDQAAEYEFSSRFSIADTVGTFVGTIIGAFIGWALCGFGLFTVGCIASVPPAAAVGGLIGAIVVGGPTLISAGNDLIQTLNAPPGTTRWAHPNR